MSNFHVFGVDSTDKSALHLVDCDLAGADSTLFDRRTETALPTGAQLIVGGESECDAVPNYLGWTIVSGMLKELLMPFTTGVQFLTAPLQHEDGNRQIKDYWIMNVTNCIECLNLEQSNISRYDDGEIMAVNEFVIIRSAIPQDIHIFRCKEFPYSLLMTDAAASSLKGKGIRGVYFVESKAVP